MARSLSEAFAGPARDRLSLPIPPPQPLPASVQSFFWNRLNYEKTPGVTYDAQHFGHRALYDLLALLEHPHRMPLVHIAGTKGKGSVATMVQRSLQAAGLVTGLYTSPHFWCLTERFVIDGLPLSAVQMAAVVEELRPAVEQIDRQAERTPDYGRLTFFDLCTAAAFVAFRQNQVQIAAIEVGMGGRLDSTNVVDPLVSVITSISYDHTEQLGDTLPKIAGEKAGIIKPNRPVVSGVSDPEAIAVIVEKARQERVPVWQLNREFRWQMDDELEATLGGPFRVRFAPHSESSPNWRLGETRDIDHLTLRMPGRHQKDNAAVAVAVLRQLEQQGWSIPDQAIRQGLAQTQVPGRIQVVQTRPWVVVDAAHNPASFQALIDTLRELHPAADGARRRLVFAVSRDKNYRALLTLAASFFDEILFCKYARNPRGVETDELERCWDEVTAELRRSDRIADASPQQAFARGIQRSKPQDLLVAAGSVFLLAEL